MQRGDFPPLSAQVERRVVQGEVDLMSDHRQSVMDVRPFGSDRNRSSEHHVSFFLLCVGLVIVLVAASALGVEHGFAIGGVALAFGLVLVVACNPMVWRMVSRSRRA
jgi:hypothetical protein